MPLSKRKIRDRWEEETCEVVHQIATDVPSYEVTDQCRWSHILHQNQLLITSEVAVPLCIGVHHAWDRCTSPTPHKPTSKGSEGMMIPQESCSWAVTQCSTSKTSLRWINGKLWLLPWTPTGASTDDGWRLQVMCSGCGHLKEHICLAEGMTLLPIDAIGWWTPWLTQLLTELGHGLQDQKGGQKGGCNGKVPPPCQDSWQIDIFYPDAEYSHPIKEGPLLPTGGWLYNLTSPKEKYQHNYSNRTRWQPGHKGLPTKWGVDHKECTAQNY